MASLYNISIKLNADLKDFSTKLQNAERDLKRFGKNMQNIGKNMSAYITAPLIAVGAGMIKMAGDAQETQNRFDAVFGNMAQSANDFADSLADSVGRSSNEIREGMSSFQSFAVGLGLANKEAFDFSTQLQTLSIDFASFNNLSDAEAQQRFISAMSGSSEVLDKFGVNLRASNLDLKLQEMGLAKNSQSATEMQKAIARLEIIKDVMSQQGAVGDAVKTSGSFTNTLKALQSVVKDLGAEFGELLLPAITKLAAGLKNGLTFFKELDERTKKIILVVAGLAAAIGPLLITIGLLSKGVALLSTGFAILTSPITLIIAAIAALVAAGLYLYDNWEAVRQNMAAIMTKLKNAFIDGIKGMISTLTYFHRKIAEVFGLDFVEEGYNKLMGWLDDFKSEVPEVTTEFKSFGDTVSSLTDQMLGVIPAGESTVDTLKNIEVQAAKTSLAIRDAIPEAITPKTGKVEQTENTSHLNIETKPVLKAIQVLDDYSKSIQNAIINNRIFGSEMGAIDEQISLTQQTIASLTAQGYDEQSIAIQGLIAQLDELLLKKKELSDANSLEIEQEQKRRNLIGMTQNAAVQLGNSLVDAAFSGANAMQALKGALIQVSKQIITAFLAQAISSAIAKAMSSAGNPILGLVLAGIAVAGVAALFASKVPKLAKGGLAFSPTYAMIGDNPNAASDPEIVSPLSKLKQYLQPQGASGDTIRWVLRGSDIYGSLENFKRKRGRTQ